MGDPLADHLIKAVDASAATFNDRGWQIKERWLEMMVEGSLRTQGLAPTRQLMLQLGDLWHGNVGGVDLAFEAGGELALVELKWDQRTLAACAWDAMKLAAALHLAQGDRAFLVGGALLTEPPLRGDRLLESGRFTPAALHAEYGREFARWRGSVLNRPREIPSGWSLRALHSAPLVRRGKAWTIRIAELTLESDELERLEENPPSQLPQP